MLRLLRHVAHVTRSNVVSGVVELDFVARHASEIGARGSGDSRAAPLSLPA